MVFAFNCVSVALIILEVLRFNNLLPSQISVWFKRLSDGRERESGTLIATHIYLLMGCAFPLSATYILTGGTVYTSEWTLWSCSGIVFLGIGDTCAAVFGKMFGKTRWRELSKKTQEGSTYCILGSTAMYFILCNIVDDKQISLFLCYVFAAIPTAVLEGCTLQYDNLSCSMFYFACVIFFNALFM